MAPSRARVECDEVDGILEQLPKAGDWLGSNYGYCGSCGTLHNRLLVHGDLWCTECGRDCARALARMIAVLIGICYGQRRRRAHLRVFDSAKWPGGALRRRRRGAWEVVF